MTDRPRDGFPVALDFAALAERDPEPRGWIVEGLIPRGANVLLGAHGGVGKSLVALQLAVCVALGLDFYGVRTTQAIVVALFAEDDASELHRRLLDVCCALGVDLRALDGRLIVFDGTGCDVALFSRRIEDDGRQFTTAEPDTTAVFTFLKRACELSEPGLLILDSVSDCFDSDESARPHVRRYLNNVLSLVAPYRGAALHLAHVNAIAARAGTAQGQTYTGSTAWNNSCRARLALRSARSEDGDRAGDDGRRELVVEKSNYSKPGVVIPLRYDSESRVFLRDGPAGDTGIVGAIRDRQERGAILRVLEAAQAAGRSVMTSPRANENASIILGPMPGFPPALRTQAGRKRLFSMLYGMEAEGLIEREAYRTPTRNTAERWRVTAAGRTELAEAA